MNEEVKQDILFFKGILESPGIMSEETIELIDSKVKELVNLYQLPRPQQPENEDRWERERRLLREQRGW